MKIVVTITTADQYKPYSLIIQVQEVLYYLTNIAEHAKRHPPSPAARVTCDVV